jgi:peroxiredoxin
MALVLLLGGHYCALSRRKVQEMQTRLEEFQAQNVSVVAVLPDDAEQAAVWQRRYDLSFPFLADPADDDESPTTTDTDRNAFGAFDAVAHWMPQTPGLALVDTRGDYPKVRQLYSGAHPQDCPSVETMLDIASEPAHDAFSKPPTPAD